MHINDTQRGFKKPMMAFATFLLLTGKVGA